jgi:hypothetical protein
MLISTTSCAPREIAIKLDGGSSAANAVLCSTIDPVYLSDAEIAGLTRATKETIAANNKVFEKLCGD